MTNLPRKYKIALTGLHAQAAYATKSITGANADKSEIVEAHRLMDSCKREVGQIIKFSHANQKTIPEVGEDMLLQWLVDKNDLSVSFLSTTPFYYCGYRRVGRTEFYFISTYFEDLEACGGYSLNVAETKRMSEKCVRPLVLEYLDVLPVELTNNLERPDLVSHVAILKGKDF